MLFKSFVMMGPRLSLLIFSVSPIIASVAAWIMLGETLGILAIVGIIVTIGGVAWVTSERQYNNNDTSGYRVSGKAILLTIGGATGQAIGLVLAKAGMGDTLDALPATFIRMTAAAAAIWLYGLLRGEIKKLPEKLKDTKALYLSLGGAFCGPFLGVWLSLAAVKYTETGIAMAIMSTVPVMVIPLVVLIHKEKVSFRAVIGSIITVGGVALLFLS
jgi:drug/metabolite transporter (DMT)-like permease